MHGRYHAPRLKRILGLRLVQQALRLDPANREAQIAQISLTLDKAIERVGLSSFPTKDPANFDLAKASGPLILSEILKTAVADGKTELAAVAATALGQVIDQTALTATGRPHPLVDALYAPHRRVQFAAAKALGDPGTNQAISRLKPRCSHPGPVCNQSGITSSGGDR